MLGRTKLHLWSEATSVFRLVIILDSNTDWFVTTWPLIVASWWPFHDGPFIITDTICTNSVVSGITAVGGKIALSRKMQPKAMCVL